MLASNLSLSKQSINLGSSEKYLSFFFYNNLESNKFYMLKYLKKKEKKIENLSNIFINNLYNVNCWYLNEKLLGSQYFKSGNSLLQHGINSSLKVRAKQTAQDTLQCSVTLSNTYRNFFVFVSYKINKISRSASRRKYFYKNILLLSNSNRGRPTRGAHPFLIEKKNVFLNDTRSAEKFNVVQHSEFLRIQTYITFLFLFVCLLNSGNSSTRKLTKQNAALFKSGGLVAKTQKRGLLFIKKNSPNFLYKYFQNFLNTITRNIYRNNYENNFSKISITILLKNFNKRYNFVIKRLLKKFRRQLCHSRSYRRNVKIARYHKLLNNTFLNPKLLKGSLNPTKMYFTNIQNILLRTYLKFFFLKIICFRTAMLKHWKKNTLLKIFNAVYIRNSSFLTKNHPKIYLYYQIFDLTGLPHNGTKTKSPPRK